VWDRKLSGAVGGGLCAASFGLILASVASHLAGLGLYLFLSVIFFCGAVLFVRATSPRQVDTGGPAEPPNERQTPTLPPPSLSASRGMYSKVAIEAEISDPHVTDTLLRVYVRSKFGKQNNGKYYAEAFGIEGRFPSRLIPGPWRVPWNDASAGRPRYIDSGGARLRLAEWNARMTFLIAGDPVKRRRTWGNGPWRVVVRLRREGSDAYVDTAFDIRLESAQIVFQRA
jgi:hypothetical protein